jgi:hypothetical protein
MEHKLTRVYLLATEEPGDYVFTLSGVVTLWDNTEFNVYALPSNHNRFRNAILRNSWADLEDGVVFRDVHFRLTDITDEMFHYGWTEVSTIPQILKHLYKKHTRHLFFLKRYIDV